MKRANPLHRAAAFGVFLMVSSSCGCLTGADAASLVLRDARLGGTPVMIGGNATLDLPASIRDRFKAALLNIDRSFKSLPVVEKQLVVKGEVFSAQRDIPADAVHALRHEQGYWIDVRQTGIRVVGADEGGLLCGLSTLESLALENRGRLETGEVRDYPDQKVRGFHLVLRGTSPEVVKGLMDKCRRFRFNTFVMQLADAIRFQSVQLPTGNRAWTTEELREVTAYGRENGLDVVPEIKLLTHQEKFFGNAYPDLMYNNATYDPRKEEVYRIVSRVFDEVISVMHPRAVHMGHDELAGLNPKSQRKWMNAGESALPAELFLMDVVKINDLLQQKGVQVWMWGDMLIDPGEFPGMFPKTIHGNREYSALRPRIPKNIVICDWHYHGVQTEYPSSKAFVSAGHRVIGVTWENRDAILNFSRYMTTLPNGGEGMLATSWRNVQERDWGTVDRIIGMSGNAFWVSR